MLLSAERGNSVLEFEELQQKLSSYKADLSELKESIGYENTQKQIDMLEAQSAAPGFWDNVEKSQEILQKTSKLKSKIEEYDRIELLFEETLLLIEMANDAEDLSLVDEISDSINDFVESFEKMRLTTLLTGEYDACNTILTFHAGAGGTEAQDWNQMLVRMYTRWGEAHGFKVSMMDFLDGDEAGLKSAVLRFEGDNAYGYLKSEAGVHRLVRISPFDASGRRHTSFASLDVMPEIDDSVEVEIRPDDLKVDTYRSSGAGGQHINKTESAIRITHLPTGIVVACQNERSQHQNREMAMKMLKSKLIEIKEREHLDKIEDIKGVQKEIAWGSQIRSYVFMPYTLVKDHRTSFESGNVGAVMDGDLDGFINAYLKAASLNQLKESE